MVEKKLLWSSGSWGTTALKYKKVVRRPASSSQRPAASGQLPAVSFQRSASSSQLPAASDQLPAHDHPWRLLSCCRHRHRYRRRHRHLDCVLSRKFSFWSTGTVHVINPIQWEVSKYLSVSRVLGLFSRGQLVYFLRNAEIQRWQLTNWRDGDWEVRVAAEPRVC